MCLTCPVKGDPLGSTALMEVVKDILVAGQEAGESCGHAHGDAGADGLYGRSEAGDEEHTQQQNQELPRCHFTQMSAPHRSKWESRGQLGLSVFANAD